MNTTARRRRRRWRFAAFAALTIATAVGIVSAHSLPRGPGLSAPAPSAAPAVLAFAPTTIRPPQRDEPCPADMVPIPGGYFFMGDDDGTKYERPAHQVRLAPYCMDRFEVTVASYKACSDSGECKRAGLTNAWSEIDARQRATFDPLCNATDPDTRAQHPINCVDWEMASRFCEAGHKRLPTEAEWEFAARGPDGRRYPWGDDPPNATLLNACGTECEASGRKHGEDERAMYKADDGFATTAPVGSFPAGASRYGVEDVVGNVWEWVDDWFAMYDGGEAESPRGPRAGTERVIRGGAWNGREPSLVRPTFRYKAAPADRSYGTGFRCASSADHPA
jgi:formylglycine-generating enzyme required for sulfatase activity